MLTIFDSSQIGFPSACACAKQFSLEHFTHLYDLYKAFASPASSRLVSTWCTGGQSLTNGDFLSCHRFVFSDTHKNLGAIVKISLEA